MPAMKGRLFLLTAALAVSLLAAEVALRVIGFSYPLFYERDWHTGGALRPGARGWWTREGRAYVVISSDGLRDREHSRDKPPGTFRVAVLGDSYAEALQLPMEQAFWAVMERELASCGALGGKTPEAINLGVSGYGTTQQLLSLRHRGWQFDPDAVVLAVTTGNDIRNNHRGLEGDPLRPYFVVEDGELVLDNSFREEGKFPHTPWGKAVRLLKAVADRSRTLQIAKAAVDRARYPAAWDGGGEAALAEAGLDSRVYLPPVDESWREAWKVTEEVLRLTGSEVRERGAELLVMTVTNGIDVDPDPARRRDFARAVGGADLLYPERRLGEACREAGIDFLPLTGELRAYAEREGVYLHGFGDTPGGGHWNADGHRLAGEAAARELCRILESGNR